MQSQVKTVTWGTVKRLWKAQVSSICPLANCLLDCTSISTLFFFFALFLCHTQQVWHSGFTLGSAVSAGLWDFICCWGIKPDWPYTRQAPKLLYFPSNSSVYNVWENGMIYLWFVPHNIENKWFFTCRSINIIFRLNKEKEKWIRNTGKFWKTILVLNLHTYKKRVTSDLPF